MFRLSHVQGLPVIARRNEDLALGQDFRHKSERVPTWNFPGAYGLWFPRKIPTKVGFFRAKLSWHGQA